MLAHLDATAAQVGHAGRRIVEAKWRGSREGFGEPGSADVPQKILLQVQAQCRVAEISLAFVPVLFLRPPVVIYEVPYDVELGDMIEAGVDRFWWHVTNDKAPLVDLDAPEAIAILKRIYPGTNGERMQASVSLERWRTVYQDSKALESEYEVAGKVAKAHLLRAMGECAELEFIDGGLLRRKLVQRKGYTVDPTSYMDARFINPKE
jgi:hypothetical protein